MQTDEKFISDGEPLRNYKDTTFRLLFSEVGKQSSKTVRMFFGRT